MGKLVKDKLRDWCRYQPRTHQDVRRKLYDGFGLRKYEVENLLTEMIEDGLVSEENFAIAFAHDHHKLNGWGSHKIRQTLKQRGISDYCIKTSLTAINSEDYANTLQKLAMKKWALLKGTRAIRQQKVANYLLRKGYTPGDAWAVVKQLQ